MTTDRRSTILAIGTGLYLLGLGFLCGIVADRMEYDQRRAAVLQRYNSAIEQWQAYRMAIEKSAPHRSALGRVTGDEASASGKTR